MNRPGRDQVSLAPPPSAVECRLALSSAGLVWVPPLHPECSAVLFPMPNLLYNFCPTPHLPQRSSSLEGLDRDVLFRTSLTSQLFSRLQQIMSLCIHLTHYKKTSLTGCLVWKSQLCGMGQKSLSRFSFLCKKKK